MNTKSWKVQVTISGVRGDEKVDNGLRFFDAGEAEQYARDLYRRWLSVKTFNVLPTEDAPNAHFPLRPEDAKPTGEGV